jgi:hypothetical protein
MAASGPRFLVTVDEDDESMRSALPQLREMKDVEVLVKAPEGKIAACNSGLCERKWDVVLLASDDMIPKVGGYDKIISDDMQKSYPDLDGVLHYNDGHRGRDLNTLCILGREYFNRFGYIYHPGYKSLWCDCEFTEVANALNRQTYSNRILIRHEHWCFREREVDASDRQGNDDWGGDENLYQKRKAAKYHIRLWDILVCSVPRRAGMLKALLANIQTQITQSQYPHNVHVIVEVDDGTMTIGAKRNRLMAKASGEYVCYVDDDDKVSGNYVSAIAGVLWGCKVDCVGMRGEVEWPAGLWRTFEHSLKHDNYYERQDRFLRPPNHLNPIRRRIAARFPFPEADIGEDTDYAMKMLRARVLKTERFIDRPLYFYIPSEVWRKKEQHR